MSAQVEAAPVEASPGDGGDKAATKGNFPEDHTRPPAVCIHCRSDDHTSYNSGEGRMEVYKCASCDKYFTRGDVDKFLSEWEETLKARLNRKKKEKSKKRIRMKTPEHLIPTCPDDECAGYMKSWWGDMGIDEIFRCDECCRPYHAKDIVKLRAQAAARQRAEKENEAARADDAPVIEVSEGGFDMADLDVPELSED